jgi:acyl dehydratase
MRAARNRVTSRAHCFETCMMIAPATESGTPCPPEPGDTIPAQEFGPFDREALKRYALVSGDDNPLHLESNAAKAAGLKDTPVHGMLMLSFFEPYILSWRSDLFIAQLSAKFLHPVLAGQSIRISGRIVSRRITPRPELVLRLIAHGPNDTLAIMGEATVLWNTAGCRS